MKIGVIGLGNIAQKAYLPVMSGMKDQVSWRLYTRNPDKLQKIMKQYGFEKGYTSLDELLASGIEAAFVHTPTETHAEMIEILLNCGIHVFVDKPVSENLEEVRRLYELAAEKGLILFAGFNRRFAPLNQELKKIPGKNLIIAQKNRAQTEQAYGFAIYDMMIHIIDTVVYLLDDPILKTRFTLKEKNGILQQGLIHFETATATAMASINMFAGAHTESVEVMAETGTHQVDDLASLSIRTPGEKLTKGFPDWTPTLEKRGFVASIESFIESVKTKSYPEILSVESAILSHQLCHDLIEQHLKKVM